MAKILGEPKHHLVRIFGNLRGAKAKKATDASAAGSRVNSDELEKLKADISAILKDRTKRQMFMEMLLKSGKEKVTKAQKISETISNVDGAILSLKPAVDIVLQIPQAAPVALLWAGICVGRGN